MSVLLMPTQKAIKKPIGKLPQTLKMDGYMVQVCALDSKLSWSN
ncbi:MAG: hypothetical protein GAK29_04627 [Acinetobacter bereziniae]|uniref:Uncharacterized protein n=1 Tax=Acinetobacter bereziniae TaxID=106648 RepID=A0A833PAZ5_ACIBZ|nr:MAG: hypothetical protein GAK29_04627 [Acinetobacter bereziniae]